MLKINLNLTVIIQLVCLIFISFLMILYSIYLFNLFSILYLVFGFLSMFLTFRFIIDYLKKPFILQVDDQYLLYRQGMWKLDIINVKINEIKDVKLKIGVNRFQAGCIFIESLERNYVIKNQLISRKQLKNIYEKILSKKKN